MSTMRNAAHTYGDRLTKIQIENSPAQHHEDAGFTNKPLSSRLFRKSFKHMTRHWVVIDDAWTATIWAPYI